MSPSPCSYFGSLWCLHCLAYSFTSTMFADHLSEACLLFLMANGKGPMGGRQASNNPVRDLPNLYIILGSPKLHN